MEVSSHTYPFGKILQYIYKTKTEAFPLQATREFAPLPPSEAGTSHFSYLSQKKKKTIEKGRKEG